MQRSRLKNIINKSKGLSQPVERSFDKFKASLPKELEIGDSYRLEAAWKAYGSPSNFKEAMWDGLVQPISENTYKLPSIGYNEETGDYEYLNKGRENETVAKDIRVWDNNVIPFVQELKQGGYVRTFNEEKDCWTYTKNSQKREQSIEDKGEQVIDSFQKGGKPKYEDWYKEYWNRNEPHSILNYNGQIYKVTPYYKQGGQMSVIPEGALHARKNNMEGAGEDITAKGIPVVDNKGEQQAEIEREEIIFSKDITDQIEKLYKKFNDEESPSKKDDIAIEMGKILTCEIIKNTDDRTGLIEKVSEQIS